MRIHVPTIVLITTIILVKKDVVYVNGQGTSNPVCNVCGIENAVMSNPNGVFPLTALGSPSQTVPCSEIYEFGLDGNLVPESCTAITADPNIVNICGCPSRDTTVVVPTQVPIIVPIPVPVFTIAPVAVPIPVVVPIPVTTPVVVTVPVPVIAPQQQQVTPTSPNDPPSRRAPVASSIRTPVKVDSAPSSNTNTNANAIVATRTVNGGTVGSGSGFSTNNHHDLYSSAAIQEEENSMMKILVRKPPLQEQQQQQPQQQQQNKLPRRRKRNSSIISQHIQRLYRNGFA